jgi:hypothetical protein
MSPPASVLGGTTVVRVVDRGGSAVPEVWDGSEWAEGDRSLLEEYLRPSTRPLSEEDKEERGIRDGAAEQFPVNVPPAAQPEIVPLSVPPAAPPEISPVPAIPTVPTITPTTPIPPVPPVTPVTPIPTVTPPSHAHHR